MARREPSLFFHIAVLSGGNGRESEVSVLAGAQVAEALYQLGHRVTMVSPNPYLAGALRRIAPDVLFPVLHGGAMEGGDIQLLCEQIGIACVGSNSAVSALASDKHHVKQILTAHGLPVVPGETVPVGATPPILAALLDRFGPTIVVKPRDQRSAFGIRRIHDIEAFEQSVADARAGGWQLMVEPLILGREIAVGILERAGKVVAMAPVNYAFEPRFRAPQIASVPLMASEIRGELFQSLAINAHRALGCTGLSRVDMFVTGGEGGQVTILEISPLPGITRSSIYTESAAGIGLRYQDLVAALLPAVVSNGG